MCAGIVCLNMLWQSLKSCSLVWYTLECMCLCWSKNARIETWQPCVQLLTHELLSETMQGKIGTHTVCFSHSCRKVRTSLEVRRFSFEPPNGSKSPNHFVGPSKNNQWSWACTLIINTALVCLAHWCVCCVGVSSALDLRPVIVRLRVGVSSALVCLVRWCV